MERHTAGDIDGALETARRAIELSAPAGGHAGAHAYLGNTLVTRRRRFREGLLELERATALDPADPAFWYTLGWCREFVANALAHPRLRHRHQPVDGNAETLYAQAREALREALRHDPEPVLRADVLDMLDVIAAATGVG